MRDAGGAAAVTAAGADIGGGRRESRVGVCRRETRSRRGSFDDHSDERFDRHESDAGGLGRPNVLRPADTPRLRSVPPSRRRWVGLGDLGQTAERRRPSQQVCWRWGFNPSGGSPLPPPPVSTGSMLTSRSCLPALRRLPATRCPADVMLRQVCWSVRSVAAGQRVGVRMKSAGVNTASSVAGRPDPLAKPIRSPRAT